MAGPLAVLGVKPLRLDRGLERLHDLLSHRGVSHEHLCKAKQQGETLAPRPA